MHGYSEFGSMKTHHGEQLRRYFDSLDLNYEQIRRRLGIGSRNTLASWLNHERLTPRMLQRLAQRMPDAMRVLTEVEWTTARRHSLLSETRGHYGMQPQRDDYEDCRTELNRWKDLYIELLSDYNDMLRRHIELQNQVRNRG